MPLTKKPCPLCGRTDGHDWDWRHEGTVAVGLVASGLFIAVAGLLTGAENLSYPGIAAWMIGSLGLLFGSSFAEPGDRELRAAFCATIGRQHDEKERA